MRLVAFIFESLHRESVVSFALHARYKILGKTELVTVCWRNVTDERANIYDRDRKSVD